MDKIDVVEREFRAMLAKMTGGVAPQDYGTAFWDWWLNLAKSPEKQAELQQYAFNVWAQAFRSGMSLLEQSARSVPGVEPRNAQLVEFAARQAGESLSPA